VSRSTTRVVIGEVVVRGAFDSSPRWFYISAQIASKTAS
jgi:hypothetical protein